MKHPHPPARNPDPLPPKAAATPERWSMSGQAVQAEEVVAVRRRGRRLPLLGVLDDQFKQIFINEVIDLPHRAASGDSDSLSNTERDT